MFGRNVVISVLNLSLDSGLNQENVVMHEYLSPGRFIDSDHPSVVEFAEQHKNDEGAVKAFARLEVNRMERGIPYLDVIYAADGKITAVTLSQAATVDGTVVTEVLLTIVALDPAPMPSCARPIRRPSPASCAGVAPRC